MKRIETLLDNSYCLTLIFLLLFLVLFLEGAELFFCLMMAQMVHAFIASYLYREFLYFLD